MPESRSDRHCREAKQLADRLKSEGRLEDSYVVERLMRTCKGSIETNRRLYRDNMELRENAE